MPRVCMRPGCDRPAAARLSYDTISCQVWLDQMPERLGPVQEICQFHAERLTVPRGWTLCDRRVDEPALFEPDARAVRLEPEPEPEPEPEGGVDDATATATTATAASPRSTTARRGRPRATPSHAPEVTPRRAGRRRHPAETAHQLFADLDSDVDAALASLPELDLDTDLDTDLDAPAATVIELTVVEIDLDLDTDAALDTDTDTASDTDIDTADTAASVTEPGAHVPAARGSTPDEPSTAAGPAPVSGTRTRATGLDALVGGGPTEEPRHGLPGHAEIMAEIVSVDPDDELPESLRATSPLLSRAFRATGPQRSVLSDDLAVPVAGREDDVAG